MLLPDWGRGAGGGGRGVWDASTSGSAQSAPPGGKPWLAGLGLGWVGLLLLAADSARAAMPKHAQLSKQTCSRRVPADAQVVAARGREREKGNRPSAENPSVFHERARAIAARWGDHVMDGKRHGETPNFNVLYSACRSLWWIVYRKQACLQIGPREIHVISTFHPPTVHQQIDGTRLRPYGPSVNPSAHTASKRRQ